MAQNSIQDGFPPPIELTRVQSAALAGSIRSEPHMVMFGPDEQHIQRNNTTSKISDDIASSRTAIVIGCVTFATGITTFLSGIVTVAVPAIAQDLHLSSSLLLWYVSNCLQSKDKDTNFSQRVVVTTY
jgi:hypothetical protein